nr:MAG TPA: tail protein [Bacteriophage sp.]
MQMSTGSNSVSNVTAGKPKVGGSLFRAPAGTTLPTNATTALDKAFQCLGYVSDEGVTNSTSIESDDIKAWGGDTVLAPQTGKTDTFQLALLESLNVQVLKAYFGDDNVTGTDVKTGLSIKCNSKELQSSVWVVEMIANGNIPHRVVIPNAKPTEMEDITYVDNDPVSLGMTLTALPDDSGNTHYEYFGGNAS